MNILINYFFWSYDNYDKYELIYYISVLICNQNTLIGSQIIYLQ